MVRREITGGIVSLRNGSPAARAVMPWRSRPMIVSNDWGYRYTPGAPVWTGRPSSMSGASATPM